MGITINQLTDEFIIHGLDIEYDYYYISHKRSEIIETIYYAYQKLDLPNEPINNLNPYYFTTLLSATDTIILKTNPNANIIFAI